MMCDHIKTIMLSDSVKKCLGCDQQFCVHPKIDHDSTCMMCGEYVTETSIEQTWTDMTFNKTNTTVKNITDHVKTLESLGYSSEIIEAAMDKFTKVGCSVAEEPAVLAVCIWMTFWDIGIPRTMIEVARKHGISKSVIKTGRQIVLSIDCFKEYKTKYITVSMMVKKILIDLEIDQKYYPHIYEMASFIETAWDKSSKTKRSAPQNIASACVFLYIQNSPTLSHMIDTPPKKKQVCKIMGPSTITIVRLAANLAQEFIEIPEN